MTNDIDPLEEFSEIKPVDGTGEISAADVGPGLGGA
jgi:hypothetical protein